MSFTLSLSWSSDETESVGNSVGQREKNRRRNTRGERGHRRHSSPSTESNDSGSTIEAQRDNKHTRRGYRHRNGNAGAGLGSSELLFTHGEEIRIIRTLRRKLLSNNGARLSRIEKRLLQADRARSGIVSISVFKAALSKETKSENGANIGRDEMIWLVEKLRGRNGKNVAILKIRGLLEAEDAGMERRFGDATSEKKERRRDYRTRRGSTQSNHRSRGSRHRGGGSDTDDQECDRSGSGGNTTSESDADGRSATALQRRLSPPPPARWAIRHGTVGQWLHDVAAPMVSVKAYALRA